MNKLVITILLATLVGLLAGSKDAKAVGISAAPDRLEITANIFSSASKNILISNVSAEPAAYQLTADNWRSAVTASPAEFILEPGASQFVEIKIKPLWPLDIKTDISAVARPLSQGGLTAAGGVLIPLTVDVFPDWKPLLAIALIVCLTSFFAVKLGSKLLSKKKYGQKNLD